MIELESRIRRAWRDQIASTDRVRLTPVRPSPRIGYANQLSLHILIEMNRPARSSTIPILIASRQIDANGPSDNVHWIPVLVNSPVDMNILHQICAPPCDVGQMLIPQPGRLRRWLSGNQQRPVTPGLFLPIWWDRRLRHQQTDEDEGDTNAMYQMHLTIQPAPAWNCRTLGESTNIDDLLMDDSGETPQEARDHTPQVHLHQESLDRVLQQIQADDNNPEEDWTIVTHGLSQRHIDTRRVPVTTLDIEVIQSQVREAWIDWHYPARLIFIDPNPGTAQEIHAIVEFYTSTPPPRHGYPLLMRIFDGDAEARQTEAGYFYEAESYYDLFLQARIHERCRPWGHADCQVRLQGRILQAGIPWYLEAGLLIDYHISSMWNLADEVYMMQMQPQQEMEEPITPEEAYTIAHTFHMSTSYKLAQIERTPGLTMTDQLTRLWQPP